ncbi:MAG: sigma-54 factor interaction domain-containing protein, partial [Bacteroidales bacterium]|nr:sigma-54 factor interaction domain-containing protein [Bacteroidales bacterium]
MDIQTIKLRYGIIGNDPKLLLALNKAIQVAPTDLSILVTGESGVGKDIFSRIIHENSLRKHVKQGKGLISVNCGAIPEGTIESELFGHVKGAFTGAEKNRKGYFEEANGGTIFLDEVGELPLATQVKLLRVLENGEIIPVGSSTAIKVNVRIVAATNIDLVAAVRNGHFR